MPIRFLSTLLIVAAMALPAMAADRVQLYGDDSLRSALTDVVAAFAPGTKVEAKFGPSGTLKDEIAAGASAHVFASANMEHPQALALAGKSGPVVLFARNRMCALVRPRLPANTAMLLDRMLDPNVKLGTSTPRAAPSGDYAWEIFRNADRLRPGAFAMLEQKSLPLVGGPDAPTAPAGRSVYGVLMSEAKADIFLTFCTDAFEARHDVPAARIVPLPVGLAVSANYGLTVIAGAPAAADRFALFMLSRTGQKELAEHGFAAPTLP
jgi:ABC-type molybdate transport system substrate-binding protein